MMTHLFRNGIARSLFSFFMAGFVIIGAALSPTQAHPHHHPDTTDHAHMSNEPTFEHDVPTAQKPWTHLQFHNDPDDFQFAIVSDNTGGSRKGIFESAVVKLNLLQPEFVMSVGDLIEGYTEDEKQINAEWNEFNEWAHDIQMPFFYVPGNHDITNVVMRKHWEQRYGVRYYSFVYKNVLFIMMDSDDSEKPAWYRVSDEQEQFVLDTLDRHPDVRWTFFFMHHPLWRKDCQELIKIEKKLAEEERNYTMFAGHVHRYMHNLRQGNHYYVLATTGGGSRLRGPRFGEFDHLTWVTVTDEGPIMANLQLDGIMDMDIYNPEVDKLARSLIQAAEFDYLILTAPTEQFSRGNMLMKIRNTSSHPLLLDGQFFHHHQVNILQPEISLEVAPGTEEQVSIDLVSFAPTTPYKNLNLLQLNWVLSYDQSPYPDLKLSGTCTAELKPTQLEIIDAEQEMFLDSITASPHKHLEWDTIHIRYSRDGSQPTAQSPLFDDSMTFDKNTTLIARVFNEKGYASAADVRHFQKITPREPVHLSDGKAGLKYTYYEGNWHALPDFERQKAVSAGVIKNLDVRRLSAVPDNFGLVFEGYIRVPETGGYTFATYSDDGSRLYIHDRLVVDNDGLHAPRLKSGHIALAKGLHPVRILYFEHNDTETLRVDYKLDHMENRQEIPSDWFVYE